MARGDSLGFVMEERFQHQIMVPFSFFGKVKITSVAKHGSYSVDGEIARGTDEKGQEHVFTMAQKWPVKTAMFEGKKSVRPG